MSNRRVIYKYQLAPTKGIIDMKAGARLLHAGFDRRGTLCVWAEIDIDAPGARRLLEVVATGELYDVENGVHVSTVVDGSFVWHVLDRGEDAR